MALNLSGIRPVAKDDSKKATDSAVKSAAAAAKIEPIAKSFLEIPFIREAAPKETDPVRAIRAAFNAKPRETLMTLFTQFKLRPKQIASVLGFKGESMKTLGVMIQRLQIAYKLKLVKQEIPDLPNDLPMTYADNDGIEHTVNAADKFHKALCGALFDKKNPSQVKFSLAKGEPVIFSLADVLPNFEKVRKAVRNAYALAFPVKERIAAGKDATDENIFGSMVLPKAE